MSCEANECSDAGTRDLGVLTIHDITTLAITLVMLLLLLLLLLLLRHGA